MIYMLGGAGYKNFGDELMVRCWLDFFRRERPGEALWIDGASKAVLDAAFKTDYPEVNFSSAVSKVAHRTKLRDFWACFQRGLSFFDRRGFDAHPAEKVAARPLLEAEVLHLHGGGYLNKHFPTHAFMMGLVVAVSRMTGARAIATGIGMTPIDPPQAADRAAINAALRQFDFIETRDRESAVFLNGLGPDANIIEGLDDTFLGQMRFAPQPGGRALHLSWNSGRTGDPEFQRVLDYLRSYGTTYDRIYFWRCAGNDVGAWDIFAQAVPGIEQLSFERLLSEPFPVTPGDHMLTARFHPHLIAARGGAIGGFYSHGKYYDVKHGSVAALGSGFFEITNKPLTPADFARTPNTLMPSTTEYRIRKLGRAALYYSEAAYEPREAPRPVTAALRSAV